MSGLTLQHHAVIGFIGRYIAEHDRSPALWEIAEGAGLTGTSQANRLVTELEELGRVKTTPGKQRSIVLVEVAS